MQPVEPVEPVDIGECLLRHARQAENDVQGRQKPVRIKSDPWNCGRSFRAVGAGAGDTDRALTRG